MTTKNCQQASEQMAPALLGDLPVEERGRLDEHVTHCKACAREMHLLSQTLRRLGSVEDVPVPRPFFLEHAESGRLVSWLRRVTLGQRVALAASALLLVGVVVLAAADLRVRLEGGVATIGFGPLPAEEGLERAVVRSVDERLAEYERATAALGEQLGNELRNSEQSFRLLLEVALASQREEIQRDWIMYATEVESGVEGYVFETLNGLNRGYRAGFEGISDRLDGWDLRSARQERRVDNLTYAVLELSSLPAANNEETRGIPR